MRVVLDTNILTRAIASPAGPAGKLLDWIAAQHALLFSPETLSELARVLAYDRVRVLHQKSDAGIGAIINRFETSATLVPLATPPPRIVPHDPDDDIVVATAVAGGADVLCTRNRHLFHESVVAYCRDHGVEIMDDLSLLQKLRQSKPESQP